LTEGLSPGYNGEKPVTNDEEEESTFAARPQRGAATGCKRRRRESEGKCASESPGRNPGEASVIRLAVK